MRPAAAVEKGRPRTRMTGTAVVRLAGRSMVAAAAAATAGTAGIAGAAAAAAADGGRRGIGLAEEADSPAAAAGGGKEGRPRKSRFRTCLDLAVCMWVVKGCGFEKRYGGGMREGCYGVGYRGKWEWEWKWGRVEGRGCR